MVKSAQYTAYCQNSTEADSTERKHKQGSHRTRNRVQYFFLCEMHLQYLKATQFPTQREMYFEEVIKKDSNLDVLCPVFRGQFLLVNVKYSQLFALPTYCSNKYCSLG